MPTATTSTGATASVPAGSQAALLHYTVFQPADAAGSWADPYILMLESLCIMSGYPDCSFRPDQPLDRYEQAKVLSLALHLNVAGADPSVLQRYADAASIPSWVAPYVAAATQAHAMVGFGIFNPKTGVEYAYDFSGARDVTRDQMATILGRLLGAGAPEAALHFTDDASIEPWALPGVRKAVAAGLLSGFPDGSFQPLGLMTRAQAAKVIAMYLVLPAAAATPQPGGTG